MSTTYHRCILCFRNIVNFLKNTELGTTIFQLHRTKQLFSEVRQFVLNWNTELESKLSSKPGPRITILQCFQMYRADSITEIKRPQCVDPAGSGSLPGLRAISSHNSRDSLQRCEEASTHHNRRHFSTKPPTSTYTAQMRSLEKAIMILLHPLCWRLMLSAGGKCTLSFANTHYNYACLSRYYNLGLKKGPFRTSSAALVKHYRCVII